MECKAIPSLKLKECFENLPDLEFKFEKIFEEEENKDQKEADPKEKTEHDDEDSMDIDQIMEDC